MTTCYYNKGTTKPLKKNKMEKQKTKKISKRRLLSKATENTIMKAVEYIIIGFLIGISFKMLFLTVVGVMIGSVFSKVIKIKLIERGA